MTLQRAHFIASPEHAKLSVLDIILYAQSLACVALGNLIFIVYQSDASEEKVGDAGNA